MRYVSCDLSYVYNKLNEYCEGMIKTLNSLPFCSLLQLHLRFNYITETILFNMLNAIYTYGIALTFDVGYDFEFPMLIRCLNNLQGFILHGLVLKTIQYE
jgi:hypothetical protein